MDDITNFNKEEFNKDVKDQGLFIQYGFILLYILNTSSLLNTIISYFNRHVVTEIIFEFRII